MRRLGKFTDPFVLEYTQTHGASCGGWAGGREGGGVSEEAAHGTGGKMRGEAARRVLTQIRAGNRVRAHVSIDRSLGPFHSA